MSRDNGVSDAQLLGLDDYATSELFDSDQRLLLSYADAMTLSDEDVDDALFAELEQAFAANEIVEATFVIALENMLSKFHRALRVESDGFCPIVVPTR